ncbi:hypothetical protein C8R43DRAFT_1111438 [Mycena crocata]|nr:hypothetical protein C8R43DRAFT_1111438 [Mycena crocata]
MSRGDSNSETDADKRIVGEDDPGSVKERLLVTALQSCFADLMKKQEEQADRIQKAVEGLKPPVPVVDKTTAFWNSYMKLADEHDKEFQQKYSADLDTGLIFAGLFSAVSSAFIIQIQPELTNADPRTITVVVQSLLYISLFTTLLAALLGVLGKQWVMYYQAAGSRGTIEERGLERQRKLDGLVKWKFDIILQMFPLLLQLALVLFSAALSVYLWSVHRPIAIIVVTLISSGFTLYFFLLASAMVSLDSPFQTPIGSVLRRLYVFSSSVLSHLASFLGTLGLAFCFCICRPATYILPSWVPPTDDRSPKSRYNPYAAVYFAPTSSEVSSVSWALETSTDPLIITAAAEIAVDLQWPLGLDPTSLMIRLAGTFDSCFEFTYNGYQFTRKLRAGMIRRAIACGRAYCTLRLVGRASQFNIHGDLGFRFPESGNSIGPETGEDPVLYAHLLNVLEIIEGRPEVINNGETSAIQWALQVIPGSLDPRRSIQTNVERFFAQLQLDTLQSLDQYTFANYLCCVKSFFGPVIPRVMVLKDKSLLKFILMTDLFKALQVTTIDTHLIAQIVTTTAKLAKNMVAQEPKVAPTQVSHISSHDMLILMIEMSRFCVNFARRNGSLDVLLAAASLARVQQVEDLPSAQADSPPAGWIFTALEHLQKTTSTESKHWDRQTYLAIESLLQAWLCSQLIERPPVEAIEMIVRALSASGNIAFVAFALLEQTPNWLLDPDFWPILQNHSVWGHLGRVAHEYRDLHRTQSGYIALAKHIAQAPGWKPFIYSDLPRWIIIFSHRGWGRTPEWTTADFIEVLRHVWVPDFVKAEHDDRSEKSWTLALAALSNVWETFDFTAEMFSLRDFVTLARCTVSTSLLGDYFKRRHEPRIMGDPYTWKEIPAALRTLCFPKLSTALTGAAQRAKDAILDRGAQISGHISSSEILYNSSFALERVAWLLRAFSQILTTELESGGGEMQLGDHTREYGNWQELRGQFLEELDEIQREQQC